MRFPQPEFVTVSRSMTVSADPCGWVSWSRPLTILKPLESLGLYGWRDALLVDGVAESATLAKRIEYSLPVSMRSGVELNYQVRTRPAENAASTVPDFRMERYCPARQGGIRAGRTDNY